MLSRNFCRSCSLVACRRALNRYRNLRRENELDEIFYTLEFLLLRANHGQGAIGEDNATTQGEIVNYVRRQLGRALSENTWQQNTLQVLKDECIVVTKIYPGRSRGTFIPCNSTDLRKPIQDLINRIRRELEHLEKYTNLMVGEFDE